MYEIIERTVEKPSPKIVERLRGSREEFLRSSRELGRRLGRNWLEHSASFEQLERLWLLRERLVAQETGYDRPLGSAELYMALHPDAERLHEESDRFWRETVGIADDLRRNQSEFLTAFLDAAVANWPELRAQVTDG